MAAQYRLGRRLGKGAFGHVFKAHDIMGRTVAVKVLEFHDSRKIKAAKKELKPLLKLGQNSHEHILPFLDHYYETNNLCLVLEYCPLGTLNKLLLRQSLNETIDLRLMAEIADGVSFLHDNNIVHRDLKPDNILIAGSEEFPVAKVGDFGLAKICGQGEESYLHSDDINYYLSSYCGTKLCMAPEILRGEHYTCLCDVFSMGVIFVAMVERKTLQTSSDNKFFAFVSSENGAVPIGDAQNRSESFSLEENILQGPVERPFKDLCFSMLKKDYNDRPSARRVFDKVRCIRHLVPRNSPQSQVPCSTQRGPEPYTPRAVQGPTGLIEMQHPALPRAVQDSTRPRSLQGPTGPRAGRDPTGPRAGRDPTGPRAVRGPTGLIEMRHPARPRAVQDPTRPRAGRDPTRPRKVRLIIMKTR